MITDASMDMKMKTVTLPDGERVPVLRQGTWRMGENTRAHKDEIAALRLGIELGMTLIDTAEMYGEGGAEEVVADAIEDQRDRVFVVSKVYRITRHAPNCQKRASAVSNVFEQTRSTFTFCIGEKEARGSRRQSRHSRNSGLLERSNAGVSRILMSTI